MKNNFQLAVLWKNHNPRKCFIHAQYYLPKSTDICDDISLEFAVQKYQPCLLPVFVHNPCGTFASAKRINL